MVKIKIESIAATIATFSWLFYWAGRFYKESYFGGFQIPYEMLGFDTWYYIYSSWVTIVVALGIIFVILDFIAIIIALLTKREWKTQVIVSIIILFIIFVAVIVPVNFSPQAPLYQKIFASKDVVIMLSILPSLIILLLIFMIIAERVQDFIARINTWFRSIGYLKIPCFVGIFAILFMFLAVVANLVGTFHASSAISQGKMGLKMVKVDNRWWLYVVRTEDGRNFIYNKEEKFVTIRKDAEITSLRVFDHVVK